MNDLVLIVFIHVCAKSKPILFIDFDGTLCHDRFWRSLPNDDYEKIQKLLFIENKEMVNGWMKGRYTSEGINDFLSGNLSLDYQKLWETFIKDCKTMRVSAEVLEKINPLRQKYKTVLITGNMDCFSRFTVPALNLDKYFDTIVNSYYEEQLKSENEGEQFLKLVEEDRVNIKQCVLIDDSVKTCKLFEFLGGKAYTISPENDVYSRLQEIQAANNGQSH